MSRRYLIPFAILALNAAMMAACGTFEVGLEEGLVGEASPIATTAIALTQSPQPAPSSTATPQPTDTPQPSPSETATPAQESTFEEPTMQPTAGQSSAPADWQHYRNDEFGLGFWYPPGTVVEEAEPSSPEFWSEDLPETIVEEQVFRAVVFREGGGLPEQGAPQGGREVVLDVKLVTRPEGKSVGEMANLFGQRCLNPLSAPIQVTTVNVQITGYRYSCEGMMLFSEFWAPFGERTDLLLGASWADMYMPLSEEVLATVTIDQ